MAANNKAKIVFVELWAWNVGVCASFTSKYANLINFRVEKTRLTSMKLTAGKWWVAVINSKDLVTACITNIVSYVHCTCRYTLTILWLNCGVLKISTPFIHIHMCVVSQSYSNYSYIAVSCTPWWLLFHAPQNNNMTLHKILVLWAIKSQTVVKFSL